MRVRSSGLLVIAAFASCFLASAQALAQNAYIANVLDNSVSVIATPTNAVTATIPVGVMPTRVAVSPDGSKVYVVNTRDNTVSAIATATNTVTATIPVGSNPVAFGVFIQPRFAGTPGTASCYGRSVSALARVFGGLSAATAALGYSTVGALQNVIVTFCGG